MVMSRSKNIIQFLARVISLIMLIIFTLAYIFSLELGFILPIFVIFASTSELVMLLSNSRVNNIGVTMMFYIYTLLCHNGFVIAYYFNTDYINFRSTTSMAYVFNDYYQEAILISNIVIILFVWATEIYKSKSILSQQASQFNIKIENNRKIIDFIGISTLIIGVVGLSYFIFSNGLFLRTYSEVMDITKDIELFNHLVIVSSLGVAFLTAAGTKSGIHKGYFIYLIYMFLHFSIGNRGEVLYAAIVCFAIYSLRFKTIKFKHVIILGSLVILIIPFVRIFREGNFYSFDLNPISSFFDVLAEQGFQISPFTYTVQYINQGNQHVFGMTYVNNFADFILRRFSMHSPWMETEEYVIKSIMPYEGMGYSMIAELYYNFTILGSILIYGLFAHFMVEFDAKVHSNDISIIKSILFAMLSVELINLTRNDASTLPVYLMYTIIFVLLYLLFRRQKEISY